MKLRTFCLYCLALLPGCSTSPIHPFSPARPEIPVGQAQTRVGDTAADAGDVGRRIAATTRETGDAVSQGMTLTARVSEPQIRQGLYVVWAQIKEQIGLGRAAVEQAGRLQDRLADTAMLLGTAQAQIEQFRTTATTREAALQGEIATLAGQLAGEKASTTREQERASAWGVVLGGVVCTAGITLAIVTQSLWGRALAIGGIVLSLVLGVIIQIFRAGEAIQPLLPWIFGSLGVIFVAWVAWEVWSHRRTQATFAAQLEQQAREALAVGSVAQASDLGNRATTLWRGIDKAYDHLVRKAGQK